MTHLLIGDEQMTQITWDAFLSDLSYTGDDTDEVLTTGALLSYLLEMTKWIRIIGC